jgi:small subunit ribosomal protein S6
MNTRYELLYIIPTTFTDEEVGGVETKINALLTKLGATIESTKRLGKFRLAYPIKKQRHGHYVMVIFTAERTALAKIEENLRIATDIIRHLTLQADEAGTDQKFELVQFTEIVVEGGRDDRRRREKADAAKKEGEKEEGKDEKAAESAEGKEAPVTTEEKAA